MDWQNLSVIVSAVAAGLSTLITVFSIRRYKVEHERVQKQLKYLLDRASLIEHLASERHVEQPEKFEADYIDELTRVSPAAAVLASWHDIEQALRDRGVKS